MNKAAVLPSGSCFSVTRHEDLKSVRLGKELFSNVIFLFSLKVRINMSMEFLR